MTEAKKKAEIEELMEADPQDKTFCQRIYLACRGLELILNLQSFGQGHRLTSLYVQGLNILRIHVAKKQDIFKICPKMRRYR